MTRRAMTAERAELLRKATAEATLDFLRVAGVNVPAHLLALGLAEALREMLGHVHARHRADTAARCAAILSAAERRQLAIKVPVHRSAAVTR